MKRTKEQPKPKAPTCPKCGAPMIAIGRGKYPYPCRAQDKHPDWMIYMNCSAGHECGWTCAEN